MSAASNFRLSPLCCWKWDVNGGCAGVRCSVASVHSVLWSHWATGCSSSQLGAACRGPLFRSHLIGGVVGHGRSRSWPWSCHLTRYASSVLRGTFQVVDCLSQAPPMAHFPTASSADHHERF